MGPRDALLVVLTACGFGSSFLFIKIIVPEVPPVTLALARSCVALATLLAVLWLGGYRMPGPGRIWLHLGALGAASQVVPMILLSWGQQRIDSGLAGIILGSVPVVTMVLAHLFMHDERMSVRSLMGAVIGLMGVVAVIGTGALVNADHELLAELAVFGAACGIAAANILARHAGHLPPVVLAASTQLAAIVMLTPLSLTFDAPWNLHPGWQVLGALVVLGVVGSALPGLMFFRLLMRVGATRASLAAYLVPLVAVALGALVLGERFAWSTLAGMGLILIGALLVNRRTGASSAGA
jgi:drug/metabolite transporter (DMT)-like permease